jgi:hypothetical protein
MTREEAERRREELATEQAGFHFFVRERPDGAWEVAKVPIPEQLRQGPLKETIEAAPRPDAGDDPRTGNERRLPGLPGGIG